MILEVNYELLRLGLIGLALVCGLLAGLWFGSAGKRDARRRYEKALEWLRRERARNVELSAEATDLRLTVLDRDRWQSLYQTGVETANGLNQKIGERDATLAEVAADRDLLRKDLAEARVQTDALQGEIKKTSEILEQSISAGIQARVESLEAEFAKALELLENRIELQEKQIVTGLHAEAEALAAEFAKALELVEKKIKLQEKQIVTGLHTEAEALAAELEKTRDSLQEKIESGVQTQSEMFKTQIAESGKRVEQKITGGSNAQSKALKTVIGETSEAIELKLDSGTRAQADAFQAGLEKTSKQLEQRIEASADRIGELEKSLKAQLQKSAEAIENEAEVVRQLVSSEARAASGSQLEAYAMRQELLANETVRKLSDQTNLILSSPQMVDLLSETESKSDALPELAGNIATARVMRLMNRSADAVGMLEECRAQDPDSFTILCDLAECYIDLGRRDDAREILKSRKNKSRAGAAFRQRLRNLQRELTSGVFLCALPKSAGVFIYNALSAGLDKPLVHSGAGGYFPEMAIPQNCPDIVNNRGAMYHIHADASRYNLIEISNRLPRMVLHLRDPRGAVLSWAHFIARVVRDVDPVQGLHYRMPKNLTSRSFEHQLDWQIDNVLPEFVSWTSDWLKAIDDGAVGTPVLVTTFEEMVADQKGFFDRLLKFHSIDKRLFNYPDQPTIGTLNFRKGDPTEWKSVFTQDQLARAADSVPVEMKSRFGWSD